MQPLTIASVATLLSTTLAAPTPSPSSPFAIVASRNTHQINLSELSASGQSFYIGAPTASYCPLTDQSQCPPGNRAFLSYGGAGGLAMHVMVPGGQNVYIDPEGKLSYTQAHSSYIPNGSITDGFGLITGKNEFVGGIQIGALSFMACPTGNGAFQVYVNRDGFTKTDCAPFDALIGSVEGQGLGAWQYT